jgi:hypothetical protein
MVQVARHRDRIVKAPRCCFASGSDSAAHNQPNLAETELSAPR